MHTLYIQYFLGQAVKFAPKDEGFDFCEFKGLTYVLGILFDLDFEHEIDRNDDKDGIGWLLVMLLISGPGEEEEDEEEDAEEKSSVSIEEWVEVNMSIIITVVILFVLVVIVVPSKL